MHAADPAVIGAPAPTPPQSPGAPPGRPDLVAGRASGYGRAHVDPYLDPRGRDGPGDDRMLEEDDLIAFCGRELARYKCPTKITFVDEIPRGLSGKTLRRDLR